MITPLDDFLDTLASHVQLGVKTKILDVMARDLCRLGNMEPAFLGYKPANFGGKEGFPAAICVSIDNEVIHGIPGERTIEEGMVVKIDMGTKDATGQYNDGATTVLVGKCSVTARRLVKATQEALEAGIAAAIPGNTNLDIARAIEAVAKKYEVFVIHGYGGHGIGEKLHMEPHIPNEIDGSEEVTLVEGQRIAIEPMFGTNHGYTYVDKDGWVIKLKNGGLAAHFEKTVEI